MVKKFSTKRALIASVLMLSLCFSMLVGTTFAWFTDSVSSSGNVIQTGKLDVAFYYADGEEAVPADGAWTEVSADPVFKNEKWEPGYSEAKHLKIANNGTLALKYQLRIIANGEVGKLADVIDVYYFDTAKQLTRADLVEDNRLGTLTEVLDNTRANAITKTVTGSLIAGEAKLITLALKMRESAGNEYQELSVGGTFDIQLVATQATVESDSFDNYYDGGAAWLGAVDTDWYTADPDAEEFTLYSAEQLAGFAQIVNEGTDTFVGKTVKLGSNIDLNNQYWAPIGNNNGGWNSKFNGTFNGNGYTISNLYVVGTKGLGLFGYVGNAAHIEGVTIDGAYVSGEDYVGAVVGYAYLAENCLINCTVKNAKVFAVPYLMADGVTYDGGAKAGVIAGLAYNGNFSGNKVIDCEVSAYRDLGGIVGMASGADRAITIENNTIDGLVISYYDLKGAAYNEGVENQNMSEVVGRVGVNVTVDDTTNSSSNVTKNTKITYTENDVQYIEYVGENVKVLYKVNETYASDTLIVPEGVTKIGSYSFYYNDNVKNVVFASTVRDIQGAFTQSKVENVVLNEGLEVISANAFKKTNNLKSVTISSTVKTIGETAFQQTGLTEIVIPENVEKIAYQAFVSSKIEEIVFEGSVEFDNRILRGCTALRTVYINGDDVSFVNTSTNGDCWISNKESNNPNYSHITFYVKNDVVAAKVRTALGAELPETTPIIVGEDYYIKVSTLDELKTALDSAVDGSVICFAADISGDVTATRKDNVNVTLDGRNKNFTGTLTIIGNTNTGSLVIKDVNFVAATGSKVAIDVPSKYNNGNANNYVKNITIDGCTFTDPDGSRDCVAISHSSGGKQYWTLKNCVVDNTMHSFLQSSNIEKSLVIENCQVYSKNGINLNYGMVLEMSGCTFDVTGYAVRFGVNGATVNGNFSIANSTLKSANDDGDAVIIFRGNMSASKLALTNTTLIGTPQFNETATGPINTIDGVTYIDKPVAIETAPLEEDFLFPAGTDAVMYKDMVMTGDAQIVHTSNAVLGLSNVKADLDHDVIVRKSGGAICISDCEFTLADGAKLISVGEGGDAHQVFLINVKVNGVLLTDANAGQYLEGISWFGAYPEWPNT